MKAYAVAFFEMMPTVTLHILRLSSKPNPNAPSWMMSFLISAGSYSLSSGSTLSVFSHDSPQFLLWIMCEYSFSYKLFQLLVWNLNHLQVNLEFLSIFLIASWLH